MLLKTEGINNKDVNITHEEIILGRENEMNSIIKHFDAVFEGAFALSIVSGEAGVGKTYMIAETSKRLTNMNVTYVYGKFKHYNNSLFSSLNNIFSSLVDHAMTFSDDKLNTLKKLLIKKLGKDSNLIIDICPNTEKLLGYYRKINEEDYHRLEYKFFNAIVAFLDVMSQELYPLMIHIDDLQWADEGSIKLLEFMIKKRNLNFYLILSLRDHPVILNRFLANEMPILKIELSRFSMSETQKYIQNLIKKPIYDLEVVTRLIYKATLGTPFYIKKLVESILENEYVETSNQEYRISLNALKTLELPDDIQGLLKKQIETLSDKDYKFLQLLACIGGSIDDVLMDKLFYGEDDILIQLNNICHTGLLLKDNLSNNYYYSHDIIYEIMYNSMSERLKVDHHFYIANKLIDDLDKIYIEEQRLFISTQLLECMDNLLKVEDTTKYVLELYHSGIKAKQVTLIAEAIKFLKASLVLLSLSDDSITGSLKFKIKLELIECLFIAGYREAAENEYCQFLKECKNKDDIVTIKSKFILLYAYEGEYKKVIIMGHEILKDLEYDINTRNIKLSLTKELIKCKLLLSNNKITKMQHKPAIDDKRILKIETTLIRMVAVANLVDEELFALLVLKLSGLSIRFGSSELASPAFAAYSFIMYHFVGDKTKSTLLKELSINLLDESDQIKCMSYFILGTFVEHWDHTYEKSVDYLKRSIMYGIKAGEFQYAGYALSSMLEMNLTMHHSIPETLDAIALLDEYDERLDHDVLKSTLYILENHLALLMDPNDMIIDETKLISLDTSQRLTYYYYKLQRLYLSGNIKEAFELLNDIEPIKGMFKGYISEVDLMFYSTSVRLENHETLNRKNKIENKFIINKSIKKFKKWINRCDENHLTRFYFIKGLYMEKIDQSVKAGLMYEEGLAIARQKNNYLQVAIGCILSSKYYEKNMTVSKIYRKEAAESFEKFGSSYLAKIYNNNTSLKIESPINIESDETEKTIESKMQLGTLMRRMESMDKDSTYLFLLDLLVKENKIYYGAVFFEKNDQIYLNYAYNKDNLKSSKQSILIDDVTLIPHKIIRYVARTYQNIILNNKPTTGLFVNDTYFEEVDSSSIICMPIKYMDVFVGIVYLEWRDENKISVNLIDEINSYMPLLITKTVADNKINRKKTTDFNDIPLTKREIDVFKLIIKGMTNKQIGETLFISLSTVKTHIINIYSKLQIKNRVAAVEKAKEFGYVD